MKQALFLLHDITARGPRCYLKRVKASFPSGKPELKTQAEVIRVSAGPAAYVLNATSIAERVIQRVSQAIGNKP